MSRDYTKYNLEGMGENLNKRQEVFTIVKDQLEKNSSLHNEHDNAFLDKVKVFTDCICESLSLKSFKVTI